MDPATLRHRSGGDNESSVSTISNGSTSMTTAESKSQVTENATTKQNTAAVKQQQQQQSQPVFRRAFSKVLRIAIVLFLVIYAVVPSLLYISPSLQQKLIFLTFVRWPLYIDLTDPLALGLPPQSTCNFYLKSEDGISLGTWLIMPPNMKWRDDMSVSDPVPPELCEGSLGMEENYPVILYLHGNSGTRGGSHRVELYKVFLKLNYHVIAFDYRGYADSSNVSPYEDGVVADAIFVYNWLKKRTKGKIIVWGHSLGTGVATKMVKQLCNDGREPDGLVLESPFNNLRDELKNHPLAIFYRIVPYFDSVVLSEIEKNIEFSSDKSITHIHVPLLMLHAEDDRVIPMHLALKLYNAALKSRRRASTEIAFHKFSADRGFGHKYICRAPELPDIVENFVSKL